MVVDTQFHEFHGRPFARALYVILMEDVGRWPSWVPPGSAGRFYKYGVVHNHSTHRYYITRVEAGWCSYELNGIKQKKTKKNIHTIRELDMVKFHLKGNSSEDGRSRIDVSMIMSKVQVRATPCTCCSRSQRRSSPGLRLRLTALVVLIARAWWISHSLITSSARDNMTKHISHTCDRRSCNLFCDLYLYFFRINGIHKVRTR